MPNLFFLPLFFLFPFSFFLFPFSFFFIIIAAEMWIILGILSATFLGFHEIFKKTSLNNNAVLPVLFLGSASSAVLFTPLLIFSRVNSELATSWGIFIPSSGLTAHLMFFTKSCIVSTAWLFGYFSVKHLQVTLLAPMNASGPVWTMLGAIMIYGERMNAMQWTGVAISLAFYYALSFGGNIQNTIKNDRKWIFFAFLSILFNSISALFDKYLVQHYDRVSMQAWFSVYTAIIFLIIVFIVWYPIKNKTTTFQWRWSIIFIGIFLVAADFFYFKGLSYEGSLVSILTIVRRASAVIVFTAGALYFKETSIRKRGIVLAGILLGVALVVVGSW